MKTAEQFLTHLNTTYATLHKKYEELFWVSYMGDHSVDKRMDEARAERDAFRANKDFLTYIQKYLQDADKKTKVRLEYWRRFFEQYQSPVETLALKEKIGRLESSLLQKRSKRKEGYIDPYTKKFVPASSLRMRTMGSTHDDEKIRKACFEARERLAVEFIDEYIELVGLRNKYAKLLGYTDFYDFKVQRDDGMKKEELFSLFDSIHQKTKHAHTKIRALEKKKPGLRKPWNFSYMMTGDFTKEEDPYFQFDDALLRWGRSFAALGIDYKGGTLQLDLLDRTGKWNNGFCHWPTLVQFKNGKRKPGSSNFTCNVVAGQVGSGIDGYNTLFHEGGHAAHLLNTDQTEVCLNQEYPPMTASWAETQSMFLDTLFSSIEWRTRYAFDQNGDVYPFTLYEKELRKLHVLRPLALQSIIFVSHFEKEIYESHSLTPKKVMDIARKNHTKYYDLDRGTLSALNVPHIYSWESSGSYHGYGLAELALEQWREYFYEKYGYIVDNPNVGKEMTRVWKWGAVCTFNEFIVAATGRKLSADAFLKNVNMPVADILARAKKRIKKLEKVKPYTKPINKALNATIRMVHGKKEIANNKKSFEDMAKKYGSWVKEMAEKSLQK